MAGFIHRLQYLMNQSAGNSDIDVNIARCMLENLDYLVDDELSINELAELCYTSTASVSRFVRKVGFDNYKDLQKNLKDLPYEQKEALLDFGVQNNRPIDLNEYVRELEHEIHASLHEFMDTFDFSNAEKLSDAIYHAPKVILLASHTTGNIAEILQRSLLMVGKYVEYYPQRKEQVLAMDTLDDETLVIVFSLEGTYARAHEVIEPLMKSPAKRVLITQRPYMHQNTEFDKIITLLPYVSTQSGKYKLLFFIEVLLHIYYEEYVK